jgi:hypothetical protein
MDTIPSGNRLTIRPPGTASIPRHSRGTAQANLLTQIASLIETYNARLRRMPLAERASNNLTSIHLHTRHNGSVVVVHHDSPTWASGIQPSVPGAAPRIAPAIYTRPIHPASRAELRAYFLRKGGDKRLAWHRFPPADAAERAQMERDLQITPQRVDPIEKIILAAARKRKQSAADPVFREQIIREQAELAKLLEDI